MSSRIVAGLSAATLAVGILIGAAGMVLVRDATGPDWNGMGRAHMMPMMGGPMMGGVDFDDMAELHSQHHGTDR